MATIWFITLHFHSTLHICIVAERGSKITWVKQTNNFSCLNCSLRDQDTSSLSVFIPFCRRSVLANYLSLNYSYRLLCKLAPTTGITLMAQSTPSLTYTHKSHKRCQAGSQTHRNRMTARAIAEGGGIDADSANTMQIEPLGSWRGIWIGGWI